MPGSRDRLAVELVVPLRHAGPPPTHDRPDAVLDDLVEHLAQVCRHADVTVVDGSDDAVFDHLDGRLAWLPRVRHLRPQPWPGGNGKVAGVVTGVLAARHEHVVVADDDVRHDRTTLQACAGALAAADLVRPHNVFDPVPWHARWDGARALLNVALGHDHPGTFGVRRSTFLAMGGYDGDVLFENLELARSVAAAGGVEVHRPDVLVPRRPPTVRHFLGQRVRQAYDDLAEPPRLLAEAALLPALALAARRGAAGRTAGLLAAGAVALAAAGRRRLGGAGPPDVPLWAPLWLAERAVCVWVALGARAAGGIPYAGGRLRVAAHSVPALRRRHRQALVPQEVSGYRPRA